MHMADALVSTPVAATAGTLTIALLAVAGSKIKKHTAETNIVSLMGVAGAFVFAAQMINFAIPGTGSSGHIVGGILLAALLGPWAGFLTLASVLIIQCLIFADGGLLALGCNILNMGAMTCLVAYPLVFRPLLRFPAPGWKIFSVSVLACTVGLELGSCLVSLETLLSGVTALPAGKFFLLMTSIHLAIGVVEGLATGAVLVFVQKARPSLLSPSLPATGRHGRRNFIIGLACAAALIGGVLAFYASSDPDGLEWSIARVTGSTELPERDGEVEETLRGVQEHTAVMPDYENTFSGIIGAGMVMVAVWGVSSALLAGKRRREMRVRSKNER